MVSDHLLVTLILNRLPPSWSIFVSGPRKNLKEGDLNTPTYNIWLKDDLFYQSKAVCSKPTVKTHQGEHAWYYVGEAYQLHMSRQEEGQGKNKALVVESEAAAATVVPCTSCSIQGGGGNRWNQSRCYNFGKSNHYTRDCRAHPQQYHVTRKQDSPPPVFAIIFHIIHTENGYDRWISEKSDFPRLLHSEPLK